MLIPADLVSRVLFVYPLFEGREVVENRGGIHLALAGHRLEGVGPGAALSHRQHFRKLRTGGLVGVNRAAMQRARVAGLLAERAMKLELQNRRKKIPRVRNIGVDVVLRAGIKIGFASRNRRALFRQKILSIATGPPEDRTAGRQLCRVSVGGAGRYPRTPEGRCRSG